MDELLPVIVGGLLALGGGLIATIGTLVNSWIQSVRDNRQWIRQKRLEAYLPAVTFLRQFEYRASVHFDLASRVQDSPPPDVSTSPDSEMDQQFTEAHEYHDYLSRIDGELAPVIVIGPDSVRDAVEAFAKGAREAPTAWFNFGRDFPPVVDAMRKAVRIPI